MSSNTFYRVGRIRDGEQVGAVIDVDYYLDATEQIDDWLDARMYEVAAEAPKDYNEKYHRIPQHLWDDEWNAHADRLNRIGEAERRLWGEQWDENNNPAVPNADYVLTVGNEVFWIEKVKEQAKAS